MRKDRRESKDVDRVTIFNFSSEILFLSKDMKVIAPPSCVKRPVYRITYPTNGINSSRIK